MKTLITGTSQGIGKAIVALFLKEGHEVIGIDRQEAGIIHENYTHYQVDIRDRDHLPEVPGVQILINNAGTQNEDDIEINLKALIFLTEKYGIQDQIRGILNIGQHSAFAGTVFWKFRSCMGACRSYI